MSEIVRNDGDTFQQNPREGWRTKHEIETDPERPCALTVKHDGIPSAMREADRWVCWRYEWRQDKEGEGKWTKVPVNARTGKRASSTNPRTWSTFERAMAYYMAHWEDGGADGLGFVLG